jgi:hypothetical protein
LGIEAGDSKLSRWKNRSFEKGGCRWRHPSPQPKMVRGSRCCKTAPISSHARHKRSACCVSQSGLRPSDNRGESFGRSSQASLIMNPPPSNDNAFSNQSPPPRRSAQGASKRRPKRIYPPEIDPSSVETGLPGIGTMARTRRLILAALRVWELKRGIRD